MLLTCQSKTTRWGIKAMEKLLLHQKQIAITSKQRGRLSWLLIWTGILTHLQVEAPESSLSTAEDELTLDARTYISVCSPHLKEFLLGSFWQPNNNQPVFVFFFLNGGMFQEHNGEQGRRKQYFCSFPSGYVKTWNQNLCYLLLFESSETMIQNSPSICEPATFKKGNSGYFLFDILFTFKLMILEDFLFRFDASEWSTGVICKLNQ